MVNSFTDIVRTARFNLVVLSINYPMANNWVCEKYSVTYVRFYERTN